MIDAGRGEELEHLPEKARELQDSRMPPTPEATKTLHAKAALPSHDLSANRSSAAFQMACSISSIRIVRRDSRLARAHLLSHPSCTVTFARGFTLSYGQ